MASELLIEHVDKIYRPRGKPPVTAVKDLSLDIRPGEITALLGSSGCGKTSTLRMIAGFEDVSAGAIRLDGVPIHTLPPARRGVAMAFEAYSLYPPLTIGENIDFALRSSRLASAERKRRVNEVAELLEISDILDKYPAFVSGGQQQRAGLGRALVRNAKLCLLDEPMGQLEPQLRAMLRGRIKHFLRRHSNTTILVTHDQTEANALADRIAVMEDGALLQYATPAALKDRPANLFVGAFIGEPPMNLLTAKATATAGENHVRFVLDEGGAAIAFPQSEIAAPVRERLRKLGRVTIGVRPHALRIGDGPIKARVSTCQWLGDQTHVAAELGGQPVVSVSHEHLRIPAGQEIALSIQPRDLHLFDSDTGGAIAHGGRPA
jgi:multiple sugar transport system ATP-binding protein